MSYLPLFEWQESIQFHSCNCMFQSFTPLLFRLKLINIVDVYNVVIKYFFD